MAVLPFLNLLKKKKKKGGVTITIGDTARSYDSSTNTRTDYYVDSSGKTIAVPQSTSVNPNPDPRPTTPPPDAPPSRRGGGKGGGGSSGGLPIPAPVDNPFAPVQSTTTNMSIAPKPKPKPTQTPIEKWAAYDPQQNAVVTSDNKIFPNLRRKYDGWIPEGYKEGELKDITTLYYIKEIDAKTGKVKGSFGNTIKERYLYGGSNSLPSGSDNTGQDLNNNLPFLSNGLNNNTLNSNLNYNVGIDNNRNNSGGKVVKEIPLFKKGGDESWGKVTSYLGKLWSRTKSNPLNPFYWLPSNRLKSTAVNPQGNPILYIEGEKYLDTSNNKVVNFGELVPYKKKEEKYNKFWEDTSSKVFSKVKIHDDYSLETFRQKSPTAKEYINLEPTNIIGFAELSGGLGALSKSKKAAKLLGGKVVNYGSKVYSGYGVYQSDSIEEAGTNIFLGFTPEIYKGYKYAREPVRVKTDRPEQDITYEQVQYDLVKNNKQATVVGYVMVGKQKARNAFYVERWERALHDKGSLGSYVRWFKAPDKALSYNELGIKYGLTGRKVEVSPPKASVTLPELFVVMNGKITGNTRGGRVVGIGTKTKTPSRESSWSIASLRGRSYKNAGEIGKVKAGQLDRNTVKSLRGIISKGNIKDIELSRLYPKGTPILKGEVLVSDLFKNTKKGGRIKVGELIIDTKGKWAKVGKRDTRGDITALQKSTSKVEYDREFGLVEQETISERMGVIDITMPRVPRQSGLQKSFTDLTNGKIRNRDLGKRVYGEYDPSKNNINLNLKKLKTKDMLIDTLAHEKAHMVIRNINSKFRREFNLKGREGRKFKSEVNKFVKPLLKSKGYRNDEILEESFTHHYGAYYSTPPNKREKLLKYWSKTRKTPTLAKLYKRAFDTPEFYNEFYKLNRLPRKEIESFVLKPKIFTDVTPRNSITLKGSVLRKQYNLPDFSESTGTTLVVGKTSKKVITTYKEQTTKSIQRVIAAGGLKTSKALKSRIISPKSKLTQTYSSLTITGAGLTQSSYYGKGTYERTNEVTSNTFNVANLTKDNIANRFLINPIERNQNRNANRGANRNISKEIPKQVERLGQKVIPRTIPRQTPRMNPMNRGYFSFYRTPPTRIPRPFIDINKSRSKSKRKSRRKKEKYKTGYTPSLTGNVFKIRGKKPKTLFGESYAPFIRPIINI